MSTRCQVEVIQEGLKEDKKVTLYHHCDGYPTNMLPLFAKAFGLFKNSKKWEADKVKEVVSCLGVADSGGFELEADHELRWDIDYYYNLIVVVILGGTEGERSYWDVEIYVPTSDFRGHPIEKNLEILAGRMLLSEAVLQAEAIEACRE